MFEVKIKSCSISQRCGLPWKWRIAGIWETLFTCQLLLRGRCTWNQSAVKGNTIQQKKGYNALQLGQLTVLKCPFKVHYMPACLVIKRHHKAFSSQTRESSARFKEPNCAFWCSNKLIKLRYQHLKSDWYRQQSPFLAPENNPLVSCGPFAKPLPSSKFGKQELILDL